MKPFLAFIIRLSILNFLFYIFAVLFLAKYNGSYAKQEVPPIISGTNSQVPATVSLETPTPKIVNLFSELQNHNSKSDCWMVYSGHIYDITPFFGSHPGGDAIMLPYCGQDATTAFDTKDKSNPSPHSENAKSLLQQYLVQ